MTDVFSIETFHFCTKFLRNCPRSVTRITSVVGKCYEYEVAFIFLKDRKHDTLLQHTFKFQRSQLLTSKFIGRIIFGRKIGGYVPPDFISALAVPEKAVANSNAVRKC